MTTTGVTPPAAGSPQAPEDTGLRCPQCEYNLTGLTLPRCPECGQTFDWDEVGRAAANRPTIACERARGWRKVPAFLATWATVLFAPWIFARQAVTRISLWHGLAFGLICFLPVTTHFVVISSVDAFYFAWISAAAIYVILQAALLLVLDPTGWQRPLDSLRFWLAVGGYTSAIVVTECVHGPVLMSSSDVRERLREFAAGQLGIGDIYGLVDSDLGWIGWLQLIAWLAGVACCYVARLRRRRISPLWIVPLAVLCVAVLLALYAFCVDPIATKLFDLYGGGLPF